MREILARFFCIWLLLTGCSSTPGPQAPPPVPAPAVWGYEKDAIELRIQADPQLNLFQKTPHTLLLCIYHLRDPLSFNQLQDERDGLQQLLECGRFDQSVLYARRLVIQPGQEIRETLDRPEGARFINFAAGYYSMQKERMTRSFPVPLGEKKRGKTVLQLPQKLSIDLYLGPQEIRKTHESQQLRKPGEAPKTQQVQKK